MYIVVSKWRPAPGRDADFEAKGSSIRGMLRGQPGVLMVESFKAADGHYVAVHAYNDEAAYRSNIHDEGSAFNKAIQAEGMEELAEWIGSESGDALV